MKTGFINLSNTLPIKLTTFVCESKLVITKKGKRDGTTHVAHRTSPFFTAMRFEFENITRPMVNSTRTMGKMFLLKDKNINLIKSPINNYAVLKLVMFLD